MPDSARQEGSATTYGLINRSGGRHAVFLAHRGRILAVLDFGAG
jgi:hypothetical protein